MDWQRIKDSICEGRQFTLTDAGCSVLADTILPSGGVVYVHLQARGDHLSAHDNGAAFDELSRHGGEIRSMTGVRRMLAETGFSVTDDGVIWRHRLPPSRAADAVSIVSDASLRAAQYLLDHAKLPAADPLDRRLQDLLRIRYPNGRSNFAVRGKHRQHTFDFGVVLGEQTVLIQAVTPDPSSVAAAIVKGMDAREAPGANVVPLFVYDPMDHWQSGTLSMLDFGGRGVSIASLGTMDLPLAA